MYHAALALFSISSVGSALAPSIALFLLGRCARQPRSFNAQGVSPGTTHCQQRYRVCSPAGLRQPGRALQGQQPAGLYGQQGWLEPSVSRVLSHTVSHDRCCCCAALHAGLCKASQLLARGVSAMQWWRMFTP